jgi:hypothetical protein
LFDCDENNASSSYYRIGCDCFDEEWNKGKVYWIKWFKNKSVKTDWKKELYLKFDTMNVDWL